MSLTTTPKGASQNAPATPTVARPQVNYGVPTQTTARVEALKAKLVTPQNNPVAPRPAGSTARAEQYAKLQNQAPVKQAPVQPMQDIEPPPSGMPPVNTAPQTQELSQVDNNVGGTDTQTDEATSQPLSPQFVALAKQERAIRKARQELKAQQQAWEQKQASFVNLDALKADPLRVLSDAGINYDRLTELQLGQVNPDPNQQLLDKIAQLEAKLAGVDEQFTKRDEAAYNAAVSQIRNDVQLMVDSDPTFETIKATGETEAVVELIRKVFDAEGTILSVEEAARLVEDKLLERKLEEVQLLSKLSKIKSRLGVPSETTAEANNVQQQESQPTLTNANSVARPLSARERAIMAFENYKNKV